MPIDQLAAIPTLSAHLLALSFALSYVGSLYVFKAARLSFHPATVATPDGTARQKRLNERWRDDPDVIKARLASVVIATFVCCAGVFAVVLRSPYGRALGYRAAFMSTLWRLGIHFDLSANSLYPHLVTPLLFAGPLYVRYLQQSLPFQRWWSFRTDIRPMFVTLQGLRNYVLGPITEELVFRACILAVYNLAAASTKRMIFLSPLSFGAAHIHHAWDTYNRYGKTSAAFKQAILIMLIQFTYTTIFGFYCAFLFLRTSSIFPPISAHVFCNIMGIPQILAHLNRFPRRGAAIIAAYIFGIVGFLYALWPWTYVPDSIYWPPPQYNSSQMVP